jgi:hypothetical protein
VAGLRGQKLLEQALGFGGVAAPERGEGPRKYLVGCHGTARQSEAN